MLFSHLCIGLGTCADVQRKDVKKREGPERENERDIEIDVEIKIR